MSEPFASATQSPDVSSIPIVDAHGHPLVARPDELTPATFEQTLCLSFLEHNAWSKARRALVRDWPAGTLPRPTMLLNYLYGQLASYLGTPLDPGAVIAARNERARDFPGYVRALLADAGVEQLVVDTGYPTPPLPLAEYAAITRIPTWEVVRIDQVMVEACQGAEEFGRFVAAYCGRLETALRDPQCVGLKSVIAYLTGLDVGPQDLPAAAAQYAAFRQSPRRRDFKALRDYCLHLALQLCREYDKPMQIHCGFGDDDIRLDRAAPRHLFELLAWPPYCECVVVLVHGGYPWNKEAALMTYLLPNVFMDISETCPIASYGVADVVWDVLQTAPLTKVMYGSDGFHLPEVVWIAAKIGRQAVAQVLSRLAAAGYCRAGDVPRIARMLLHDNAVGVYLREKEVTRPGMDGHP